MSTPLTQEEIYSKASGLLEVMAEQSVNEVLFILCSAIVLVASREEQPPVKKYKGHSRITRDPEVEAFINTLGPEYYIDEILALIIDRFGKERAPSRSGLHRYLSK